MWVSEGAALAGDGRGSTQVCCAEAVGQVASSEASSGGGHPGLPLGSPGLEAGTTVRAADPVLTIRGQRPWGCAGPELPCDPWSGWLPAVLVSLSGRGQALHRPWDLPTWLHSGPRPLGTGVRQMKGREAQR